MICINWNKEIPEKNVKGENINKICEIRIFSDGY